MCTSRGKDRGRGRERIPCRLCTEPEPAHLGVRSLDPQIMTWAETKVGRLTHWAIQAHPTWDDFQKKFVLLKQLTFFLLNLYLS